MSERFYLIINHSEAPETSREQEDLIFLRDGSAVICSVGTETVARSLATGDQELAVRSYSGPTPMEQRRMQRGV